MNLVLGFLYLLISFSNCNAEGNNVTIPRIAVEGIGRSTIQAETFTPEEKNALEKLRPLVKNILVRDEDKSDGYLIRWLRARNLDIPKAADMLRASQKWRRENNIDSIINETIFDFQPSPFTAEGFDREGHPIILLSPGLVDIRKLALQGQSDKIYRYIIQVIETGMASRSEASKKFGREIHQVIPIFDFDGINLRQHLCLTCAPLFRDLFIAFENYYPEALKYIIGINIPRAALPLIELLKPLASSNTLKVFRIFPPNRKEWSEFLLKIIAPDQLPRKFGGTKSN